MPTTLRMSPDNVERHDDERRPISTITTHSRWEHRSIEAWENLRCLGKRFERTVHVEVIDALGEEIQWAHENCTDDDRPRR